MAVLAALLAFGPRPGVGLAAAQGEPGRILGVIAADLPPGRPVGVAIAPGMGDLLGGRVSQTIQVPGPGPFMFAAVPPGSYVLAAYMDRNGNGAFDRDTDAFAVQRERVIVTAGADAGPIRLETFFNTAPVSRLKPEVLAWLTQQAAGLYQAATAIAHGADVPAWQKRRATTLQYRLRNLLYWSSRMATVDQFRYMFVETAAVSEALPALQAGTDPMASARGPMRGAVYSSQYQAPWPYALYVPPAYDPARSWPLFVVLHGAGGNADGMLHTACGAGPWGKPFVAGREPFAEFPTRDAFVLCPFAVTDDDPFDGIEENVGEVLASIDAVLADYHIAPKRTYLLGVSMGGGGAWRIGLTYPERFAAIASLAGTLPLPLARAGDAPDLPVLLIHGVHDRVIPIDRVRAYAARRQELGGRVELREEADRDHYLDIFGFDPVFAALEEAGATRRWPAGDAPHGAGPDSAG